MFHARRSARAIAVAATASVLMGISSAAFAATSNAPIIPNNWRDTPLPGPTYKSGPAPSNTDPTDPALKNVGRTAPPYGGRFAAPSPSGATSSMTTMTTTSGPTITGTSVHGQEDFEPELGVAVSDASGTPETVYYLVRSAGSSTWNVTNGHTETGSAGDEILYKVEPGKLLPGKTYEWSARACNGSTCSGYTAVSSWTVDPTSALANVAISASSPSS